MVFSSPPSTINELRRNITEHTHLLETDDSFPLMRIAVAILTLSRVCSVCFCCLMTTTVPTLSHHIPSKAIDSTFGLTRGPQLFRRLGHVRQSVCPIMVKAVVAPSPSGFTHITSDVGAEADGAHHRNEDEINKAYDPLILAIMAMHISIYASNATMRRLVRLTPMIVVI